jgi:hypothetical protein
VFSYSIFLEISNHHVYTPAFKRSRGFSDPNNDDFEVKFPTGRETVERMAINPQTIGEAI